MTTLVLLMAGLVMAQEAEPAKETTRTATGQRTPKPEGAEKPAEGAEKPAAEGAEKPAPVRTGKVAGDESDAKPAEEGAAAATGSEVPEDVEPGSEKVEHTVKEGETVESIANDKGFLPDDIRRWNNLDADAEPKPGDTIVVWVAPMPETEGTAEPEPEPEPEPKAKKERETDDDDRKGVGFFAGISVGPAFSLSPLNTAVSPRLELGLELPPLDRSFRIFVSGQYLRPIAADSANDPRIPPDEKFDYELKQDELSIAFGPAFRAGMIDGPVKPELSIGPNIYMYRSTVNGSANGADFPESTEQYTRVGIYAAGGIGWELGPGELTVLLTLGSSGFNGTITGEANSLALSPMLGYRFVF